MQRSIVTLGLLALACADPDPGTLTIEAPAAQGGVASVAPGDLLGSVVVSRVGADPDELETPLPITLTHDGDGELRGATEDTIRGRAVTFTDLRYFGCGSFRITATPDDPRIDPVTTGPILVAPTLEIVSDSADAVVDGAGPIEPIVARLLDSRGGSLELEGLRLRLVASGGVSFTGGSVTEAVTDPSGVVAFTGLEVTGVGLSQLRVESAEPTCPIRSLDAGIVAVGALEELSPRLLSSGRVGVPYREPVTAAEDEYRAAFVAPGLTLDTMGVIHGIPTTEGVFDGAIYRVVEETVERIRTRVAIFPEHDPELPEPVDPAMPGEHAVEVTTLTVPTVETSLGTLTDVPVRVAYPSDGAEVPDGRWPAVVFAPTVAEAPALHDLYTELHDHWASHGIIVYSVDTSAFAAEPVGSTAILDHAALVGATVARARAEDVDGGSALFEAHDTQRLFVAGHGAGGGGALIAAQTDPFVAGVLAFEPVLFELAAARDGDATPLEVTLDVPLMLVVAGDDRVVPWPEADLAAATTSGPTAVVTIHGANHLGMIDEAAPQTPLTAARITRAERRAVERRYTTAFLRRFGLAEPGFEATVFMQRGQQTDLSSLGVSVRARRRMNTRVEVPLGDGFGSAMGMVGSPWRDALFAELGLDADRWLPNIIGPAVFETSAMASSTSWTTRIFRDEATMLANRRSLVFDVTRDCPPPPADPMLPDDTCPDAALTLAVSLEDDRRITAQVDLETRLPAGGVPGRHWTTVRVPMSDFTTASTLDPALLESLTFDFEPDPDPGRVWIGDVRFE